MVMHILYDYQIFTQQNYGGISRYFCELMDRFSLDPDVQFTLALKYSQNENLMGRPALTQYWSGKSKILSHRTVPLIQHITHFDIVTWLVNRLRLNQRESVRLLKKQDFDLFHPTYYDPYFLEHLGKKPFVLTVYDMIHELYPDYFSPQDPIRIWKKQLIEKADAVIAISQNTRNDILRFADVEPRRVSVVYLGNSFEFAEPLHHGETSSGDLFIEKSYLLFVGNRSGYKNFGFFVTAVAKFLKNNEGLQVYCAGGGSFTPGELNLLKKLNLLSKVHYFRINDSVIKYLYKNALAFVFPSLYEGFGLPVLEAFSCGCPTIVSNSSSLSEIAGDAACYIDPGDAESLMRGIESVLSDRYYREELIKKGYERLKFFSWEKTALETKKVYDNLLYQ
jgi:glycosyltransferase involved in cell wall biosynthesis